MSPFHQHCRNFGNVIVHSGTIHAALQPRQRLAL